MHRDIFKKKNFDYEAVQFSKKSLEESLEFFKKSKDYGYSDKKIYKPCIDEFARQMENSSANAIKIVFDAHGSEDHFLYAKLPNNKNEIVNKEIIDCLNYLFEKIISSEACRKKNINIFKTACYDASNYYYKGIKCDFVENILKNFAKNMSRAGKKVNIIYTSNFSENHIHTSNNHYFINYLNKYSVYDYREKKFVSFSPDLEEFYSDEDKKYSYEFKSITDDDLIDFRSSLCFVEDEVKEKIKEVKEEIKEVEEEIEKVEEEIEKVKEEFEKGKKKLKEDVKKFEKVKEEFKKVKEEIKEYRKNKKKNPILEKKMEDSLIKEKEEKKECLKQMMDSLEKKDNSLIEMKNSLTEMRYSFRKKNDSLERMKDSLEKMNDFLKKMNSCVFIVKPSEELSKEEIKSFKETRDILDELEYLGLIRPFLETVKSKNNCKLLFDEKIYERMKETHQTKDEFLFFDTPREIKTSCNVVETNLGTGNLLKIRNFLFEE